MIQFWHKVGLLFCLLFSYAGFSQSGDSSRVLKPFHPAPKFHTARFCTAVGTEVALHTATLIGLNEIWYKPYPKSSFHSFDDSEEWLQMDKVGHTMTAYYTGLVGHRVLRWAGVEEKPAAIYGGLLGFSFLTSVEIIDAFNTQWGFSWSDFGANALGTALFVGQELAWKEQRVLLKMSFHLTRYAQYRPSLLGSTPMEKFMKDYNGHTFWLSVNLWSFFKQSKIPKWLNVAFGYGAEGMTGARENPPLDEAGNPYPSFRRYRQFYLSLDVDLTKIKTKSKFLNSLFTFFGFVKVPFPAIEFNDHRVKFHPFYF